MADVTGKVRQQGGSSPVPAPCFKIEDKRKNKTAKEEINAPLRPVTTLLRERERKRERGGPRRNWEEERGEEGREKRRSHFKKQKN